jgi:hypothetical protein
MVAILIKYGAELLRMEVLRTPFFRGDDFLLLHLRELVFPLH